MLTAMRRASSRVSRCKPIAGSLYRRHVVQHLTALSVCIGGQAAEPYEQNTQQSPGFGRNLASQPLHS
jgi:hypothetical protein